MNILVSAGFEIIWWGLSKLLKMENSYPSLSNGSADPGLQIIRHPSYHTSGKLTWFDTRVFYVRISNFSVDDSTPEFLTLNHIPLSHDTLLEVNGARCSIYSDGASCLLRRDRADKKTEEATFVTTDSIRFTGSVKFEVFHKEDLLISGVLEMSCSNGFTGESKSNSRRWVMNCDAVMSPRSGFFKGKQVSSEAQLPAIEVYVAGCFLGCPIILTKSLQLNNRKKNNRKGMLDSIPEYETADSPKDFGPGLDLQVFSVFLFVPPNWRFMKFGARLFYWCTK